MTREDSRKSKSILKIDEVLDRIKTHPEYSVIVLRETAIAIRDESNLHSLALEKEDNPEHGKHPKEERRKGVQQLNRALSHLSTLGISVGSLSPLGHTIEPEENNFRSYRKTQVLFGGFTPPSADTLLYHMDQLVAILEYTDEHPITRALQAHIEMVKIHPYEDGNGRAARLLQNFCLQQRGYPAAVIPLSDRELYLSLLGGALEDRYDHTSSLENPSEKETLFRQFIISKVLASSEKLEEQLSARRIYDVTLSHFDHPGAIYSVAKTIRGLGRREGRQGVSVHIDPANGRKSTNRLRIVGDVGLRELKSYLNRTTAKYGLQYRVNPVDTMQRK